jgi:iron(II)-dependent oxidoreductase
VRDSVLEALDVTRAKPPDAERRQSFYLVFEHELMHQETLLYMVHQLAPERKIRPRNFPEDVFNDAAQSVEITVPAGRARLGASHAELDFGWDNEFEAMTIDVPAFKIDSLPVTIGEYHEFVASGAYDDRRYWSDADWAWKARENLQHPNFWFRERGSWFYRTMFDLVPLAAVFSWPVYSSLAEARAYARWKNKRLPSEAEYHRAAFCRPDGSIEPYAWGEEAAAERHGNFNFIRWSPEPVGSRPDGVSSWGIHELCGNGWEWTDTAFAPFSGFAPQRTYPQYSADFFDGKHFVLKGASWATAARLIRPSFRNWYQAHYPYVFAKFRCVSV